MKFVIIGGVAVGAGAAARARRLDENAEIVLIERGEHVSFANCGLPYYVGGDIKDRKKLLLHTPQSLYDRFRIDVRTRQELRAIDREHKRITIHDLDRDELYEESYDKLVLAQGATPVRPPIPGIDLKHVYQLRSVPDADALFERVKADEVKRAVVIGAGFIGLEMVEAFIERNIQVTLIEKADQILPPMDPEMTILATRALREAGADVILGDGIKEFRGENQAQSVLLESGKQIEGDLFLMGLGVRPDVSIALDAGLVRGATGALAVNEHLQTNDLDIYAAGDLAETTHLVTGATVWIPLAGPANKQARVIATHATGGDARFSGVLGTSIVRFQHHVLSVTGLTEKTARRANVNYQVSYTLSGDHASYYPGAKDMLIKLLFASDTGRVLGAQIIGQQGVDKRIDVLATAIQAGMTVQDLTELDLAYAPPFSSAKDPVIIAGMAAQNILDGDIKTVQGTAFDMFAPGVQIVDVREPHEVEQGAVPGAVNIPLNTVRDKVKDLDTSRPVVVYCRGGQRSYNAVRILQANGFDKVYNWSGGYFLWDLLSEYRNSIEAPLAMQK